MATVTYAITNTRTKKWLTADGKWIDSRAGAQEHETHQIALDHWNKFYHPIIGIVMSDDPNLDVKDPF